MKRRFLSLAMAAALVLPVAVSHALPAAADYGTNVICPMQQPAFNGTFDQRHYSFTLACYGNQNFQVSASYNGSTRQASEKLVGAGAATGELLEASWNCPSDPWGTEILPVCTNTNTMIEPSAGESKIVGFLAGYDLSHSTLPYSAQSLDQPSHATLGNAALQDKLAQRAPAPQSNNFEQRVGSATTCVACLAAAASPSPNASAVGALIPAPTCLICQLPGR